MNSFDPSDRTSHLPIRSALPAAGDPDGKSRFRWDLHPLASASIVVLLLLLAAAGVVRTIGGQWAGDDQGLEASDRSASALASMSEDERDPNATESGSQSTGGTEAAPGPVSGFKTEIDAGEVLVVFVTGAVREPGVVSVPLGSRAEAAVLAAGGLAAEADMTSVNLASPLVDGEHVHVAAEGETKQPVGTGVASGTGGAGLLTPGAGETCVSLNQASEDQLQALDGVGPKIAARIVERREALGGFSSNEDLLSVSGIGHVLYGRISAGLCQ